jgi:hypothetical protein
MKTIWQRGSRQHDCTHDSTVDSVLILVSVIELAPESIRPLGMTSGNIFANSFGHDGSTL